METTSSSPPTRGSRSRKLITFLNTCHLPSHSHSPFRLLTPPRKEARAEQNRKAQQIFRRKREEKIKQLELDSMALNNTRQRLIAAEARLSDMALVRCPLPLLTSVSPSSAVADVRQELEAKVIEAQGLRRALATAANVGGLSLTKADGSLVLSPDDYEQRDRSKIAAVHLDVGCDGLARASRQLAKANRQRRDELRHAQEASQHAQA